MYYIYAQFALSFTHTQRVTNMQFGVQVLEYHIEFCVYELCHTNIVE